MCVCVCVTHISTCKIRNVGNLKYFFVTTSTCLFSSDAGCNDKGLKSEKYEENDMPLAKLLNKNIYKRRFYKTCALFIQNIELINFMKCICQVQLVHKLQHRFLYK